MPCSGHHFIRKKHLLWRTLNENSSQNHTNLQKNHGEILKKCFIMFCKEKYFSISIATRSATIDTVTQLFIAILSIFSSLWYCVSLYGLLGFFKIYEILSLSIKPVPQMIHGTTLYWCYIISLLGLHFDATIFLKRRYFNMRSTFLAHQGNEDKPSSIRIQCR